MTRRTPSGKNKNEKVILVRHETSPRTSGGMWAAKES